MKIKQIIIPITVSILFFTAIYSVKSVSVDYLHSLAFEADVACKDSLASIIAGSTTFNHGFHQMNAGLHACQDKTN